VAGNIATFSTGQACHAGEWEKNGHTYQVTVHDCDDLYVTYGGEKYYLLEYHFHSLSETMFNGQHFDGEIQMVHNTETDGSGKYLILAVWLTAGSPTDEAASASAAYLTRIFGYGFTNHDQEDVEDMNPYVGFGINDAKFFSYKGSFTTPPCTPDVQWLSTIKPAVIPVALLSDFRQFLKGESENSEGVDLQQDNFGYNFRPVQPLNGREITIGKFKAGEVAVAIATESATEAASTGEVAAAATVAERANDETSTPTALGFSSLLLSCSAVAAVALAVSIVVFKRSRSSANVKDLTPAAMSTL
jgi:carbonic anhydrase